MPAVTARQWRLDLPLTRPLSLNDRSHWRVRATAVADVRALARIHAKHTHKLPAVQRVAIELHYIPRDKRRRDPLNLVATLKAVEDGIVDAGVIPDDTPDYSVPTMPVIDEPDASTRTSRIYVLITEVPA